MKRIKIGSIVRIIDGSYMLTQLPSGKLAQSSSRIQSIGHNEDNWDVLLINIALPTEYLMLEGNVTPTNNILIKNQINGELWFCSVINISVVEN